MSDPVVGNRRLTWRDLEALSAQLVGRFSDDVFVAQVLAGALRVGEDAGNPIRGNLLAAAARELVTHILHELAPDEDVQACAWFVQNPETETITRAQRARYIIHGGLRPAYVRDTLELDPTPYVRPLTRAMSELNRRTHVKRDTVLSDDVAIRELAADILEILMDLLDIAAECRTLILAKLRDGVDQAILDRTISDVIGDVDELSSHTLVDELAIEGVEVAALSAREIRFGVEGTVYVTLQYGSGSDFRRGDGATMTDNYPFRATVIAHAGEPERFDGVVDIDVDTRSFYDDGDPTEDNG